MQNVLSWPVLYYLNFIARIALFLNKPEVIGVTGSAGKSSTRNAISAVLKDNFKTKTIEEGNSESGIPLGILGLAPKNYSPMDWLRMIIAAPFGIFYLRGTKYLVVEMGIDDPNPPKNMEYLLTIIKPKISVFINVHPVHTMQFEKSLPTLMSQKNLTEKQKTDLVLRKIAEEKGKIITDNPNCKHAIFNKDNIFVNDVIKKIKSKSITKHPFGKNTDNSVQYTGYDANVNGSSFSFFSNETKRKYEIQLTDYLLPEVYKEGLACAIAVGEILGMSKSKITDSLEKNFKAPKGRSSLLQGINDSIIIDSSYNSSKAPTLAFLNLLSKLKKESRPAVFLFGDMRELGERAKNEHEEVAEKVFETVNYLYCVGPLTKEYVVENPKFKSQRLKLKEMKWFKNSLEAGKYLEKKLPKNSIILVKGSQNTIFLEEAIKFILKNKEDEKKLCRQSDYWIGVKDSFFK